MDNSYCEVPFSLVNVTRLSSSDIFACGLVVRMGFQGVVGKLFGLTSKWSWGFEMLAFLMTLFVDLAFLGFVAWQGN